MLFRIWQHLFRCGSLHQKCKGQLKPAISSSSGLYATRLGGSVCSEPALVVAHLPVFEGNVSMVRLLKHPHAHTAPCAMMPCLSLAVGIALCHDVACLKHPHAHTSPCAVMPRLTLAGAIAWGAANPNLAYPAAGASFLLLLPGVGVDVGLLLRPMQPHLQMLALVRGRACPRRHEAATVAEDLWSTQEP
eukprot:1141473-Pelagomonas_calceolata.AAC.3